MDLDAILRRIQKLLAIAQDSRGDPNETAAAAAQAENLMRKFNLEHADVLAADLKRNAADMMEAVRVNANMKRDDANRTTLKRAPKWAGWLAVELALLHDAQVRYAWDDKTGVVVEFCGVKSDVQVAGWMFDYLVGQMIIAVRNFGAEHRRLYGTPPDKVAGNAYRTGFVQALTAALRRMRNGKVAELQHHASGTALVVAKKAAIEEHFGEFAYGKGRGTRIGDREAYAAGAAAGRKVDVQRRAVSTATDSTLRIAR